MCMMCGVSDRMCGVRPDGFGDKGREAKGAYPAIPPNSTLDISLKLSGWISVEKVTDDWKVKKKALKEGEGYEKPNEMAKVKGEDRTQGLES